MFGYLKGTNINIDNIRFLSDGETIKLGEISIKVYFTPGHTNCSVCYLIEEYLFSGDTLFKNSVGRTDLPTGSNIELTNSVKKILNFKNNHCVYPGHDSETTIFDEVKYNPYYLKMKQFYFFRTIFYFFNKFQH